MNIISKFNLVELTAPTSWASALINGDASGLEPDERALVERFISETVERYGHANFHDAVEQGFRPSSISDAYVPWAAGDFSEYALLVDKK